MYFFHSLDMLPVPFSRLSARGGERGDCSAASARNRSAESGIPVVVRDLGRGRDEPWSSGVVGEELVGDGILGV